MSYLSLICHDILFIHFQTFTNCLFIVLNPFIYSFVCVCLFSWWFCLVGIFYSRIFCSIVLTVYLSIYLPSNSNHLTEPWWLYTGVRWVYFPIVIEIHVSSSERSVSLFSLAFEIISNTCISTQSACASTYSFSFPLQNTWLSVHTLTINK